MEGKQHTDRAVSYIESFGVVRPKWTEGRREVEKNKTGERICRTVQLGFESLHWGDLLDIGCMAHPQANVRQL